MRIGQGFDAHRFKTGGRLVIGGVDIPSELGLEAHSDGDVLLHAITDAVFGAAALGDLGKHFPDTDAAYAGVDSRVLLRDAITKAAEVGWRPVNIDATVVAQRPRLAPHIAAMRANIAADMALEAGAVNVKATTTEGMGFTGRGEGMAALAVVLLQPL